MKRNKGLLAMVLGCMAVLLLYCGAVSAAPANRSAKYSVDATEIEYDLKSGSGTTIGKTTIQYGDSVAVAQGGATFNSKDRTGRLYGGVTADKGDNHLQSEELVMYTGSFLSAVGNAVLTKGDKTLKAPRVDYHDDKKFAETLGGTARLSSADGSWLSAGKIVYDMKTGVANATGGVTMANTTQKMNGSGDRAVYDPHETGYIELIGHAKVTRDGNTVTGDRVRITNAAGSDSRTHVQGNVRIVYYPEAAEDKDAAGGEKILAVGKGKGKAEKAEKAASHTEDKKA